MKDLTIIGAGPTGLYATFYAALRQMSVNLIESMPNTGGQPSALYGDKYIYDLPGFDKITAKDFIARLDQQIEVTSNGLVDIHLSQEIKEIKKVDDYYEITSHTNEVYQSKAILITAGNGMFVPRKMGVEHEENFKNILYSVTDINIFKDKTVTILGGGDSALDWAMMIEPMAKNVNLVHRRDEYRAKEDGIERLNNSSVNQYKSYLAKELIGEGDQLKTLVIQHKETEEIVNLEQDIVLVNYGNVTKISDFGGLPLEKEALGYKVNQVFETSLEGIYACGNAINYTGRPKLITVGLGEVPVVINNIKGFIDPSSKNKIYYSSAAAK